MALIRHAGKDGTPKGSSAFEAEADICVTLSRPEGRHAPSVRRPSGIGRYGEWERRLRGEGMGIEQAMIFVGHRFRMWHLKHLPLGQPAG